MQRVDSLEKTLILGGIGVRRRRGWQRMRWLDGITDLMDMSLSNLCELVMGRDDWRAVIRGVTKSRTWLSDWTEHNLKPGSMIPPTLFFLEISLAIQASCMWFHTYFRVVYSISVTGSNQHFDDIESVDYFGQHGYFNSTIFFFSPIHEHGISFHYLCLLQFVSSMS